VGAVGPRANIPPRLQVCTNRKPVIGAVEKTIFNELKE
jgi:hypothetical protein